MQIWYYLDEDAMSRALVNGLRARGVSVTTVETEKRAGLGDQEQLDYLASQEMVLYTFNTADFYRLHKQFLLQGKNHAGIIFAPQQHYSVGEQMRRLLKLAALKSAEEMRNNVEFLSSWG